MPDSIASTFRSGLKAIGTIGSLFIKRDTDGKYSIAVAPMTLLLFLGTGVTCGMQTSEPFSVCVKTTTQSLKELFNAN